MTTLRDLKEGDRFSTRLNTIILEVMGVTDRGVIVRSKANQEYLLFEDNKEEIWLVG